MRISTRSHVARLISVLATALAASAASAQSFTPGNIVLLRVGDGTTTIGTAAAAVTLLEISPAGSIVQQIPITSIGGDALTLRGSSTTEGALSFSANGQYLVFGGYRADAGAADPSTSTTIPRVIGRVATSGLAVNTATSITDGYLGNSFRGVASLDGTSFYGSGDSSAGSSTGSVRYISTFGGSATSVALSAAGGNTRQVQILANPSSGTPNLFVSSGAGTPGRSVFQVGSGLPTSGAQTFNSSFPLAATSQYQNFYFARLGNGATWNPNGGGAATDTGFDTIYVSDSNAGNLAKFSFDGTSWAANNTVPLASITGLTAAASGSTITFFATTSGAGTGTVQTLTDATGFNQNMTAAFTSLGGLASGANYAFRGIAVVPVPEPVGIIAFAAIVSAAGWMRRRNRAA